MKVVGFVLLLAAIVSIGDTEADSIRDGPLEMELISENISITPGESFYVGWRISRDEGWHTYWKHPGDVGVSPELKWRLPEGFRVGELRFPPPQRIKMASVSAYGHKGETLFLTKISVPLGLPIGKIVFRASASWLTCSRECRPGFRELALELPVRGQALFDETVKKRFDDVRSAWPTPLKGWTLDAREKGRRIILRLEPPFVQDFDQNPSILPGEPYFFGEDRLIRSNKPQVVKRKGTGFQVRLTRAEWAPEGIKSLKGVLFAAAGWGRGHPSAYARIDVPLRQFAEKEEVSKEP